MESIDFKEIETILNEYGIKTRNITGAWKSRTAIMRQLTKKWDDLPEEVVGSIYRATKNVMK